MKKPDGWRFAQMVDYNINTADCQVVFRYMMPERDSTGTIIAAYTEFIRKSPRSAAAVSRAFVWLSLEQEKAVREWWLAGVILTEHEDKPLEDMVFSLRKNQLPQKFRFWPRPVFKKGAFISESQGLMGYTISSSEEDHDV